MIPELLMEDSRFRNDFNAATPTETRVRVSLKEGVADRKEWVFAGYFLIGQGKSADVSISNPHVSRLHTYVYFKDGKWWLQDLKFSNGTIVNGEKISKNQRHPIGTSTQLRLGPDGPLLHLNIEKVNPLNIQAKKRDPVYDLAVSDRPPSKELVVRNAAGSKRKKLRRYLFVLAPVILIGLILARVGSLQKGRRPAGNQINIQAKQSLAGYGESKDSNAKPGSEKTSTGSQVNEADRGGQAAADGSVGEANHNAVQSQTAGLYFDAAVKLADNRHWQAALEYCHIVAEINPAYPALDMQIARIKSEAENKKTCEVAQDFISNGKYPESLNALSKVDGGSVYFMDACQIRSKAETKQKQRDARQAQVAENQKADMAIKKILELYKKGETGAALTKMDSVMRTSNRAAAGIQMRVSDLKEQIRNAQYLYLRGNEEYMSGHLGPASKTLIELIKVDKEILGNQRGLFVNGLSRKIANEYGGMAMRAYTESDFPRAFQFSQTAFNFDKRHWKALSVEKMLLERSKQLYLDGYILEEYNPEKAREKWMQVLEICSPGTDYYQKALLKVGKR